MRSLRGLAVDLSPLRHSRDYRLLALGGFVSGLGSQVTIVALPFQVYVLTRSSFDVGLIGLAELAPFVAMSLIGGALADRTERRRLLMIAQLVQLSTSALLALGAGFGPPPLAGLYVLAAIASAASAVDRPTRNAIVPTLVEGDELRPAIAFNYGLAQLTQVVGPAIGGIVIAAAGIGWAYTLDVVTFAAMVAAVALMSRQHPLTEAPTERFLPAVRAGLAFARSRGELMGGFAVDLLAMTFGMPRALFPALSLTVYHSGATGVGLLYAALSAGATVAAFSTGWLTNARRLGRVVVVAIVALGPGDNADGPHPQPGGGAPVPADRGLGRQRQRRLPQHHPLHGDSGGDAGAPLGHLPPGRRRRPARGRHRIGLGRGRVRRAHRGDLGRHPVPRRPPPDRRRLPRVLALWRRRHGRRLM